MALKIQCQHYITDVLSTCSDTYHPEAPPTAICFATEALVKSPNIFFNHPRSVKSRSSNSASSSALFRPDV